MLYNKKYSFYKCCFKWNNDSVISGIKLSKPLMFLHLNVFRTMHSWSILSPQEEASYSSMHPIIPLGVGDCIDFKGVTIQSLKNSQCTRWMTLKLSASLQSRNHASPQFFMTHLSHSIKTFTQINCYWVLFGRIHSALEGAPQWAKRFGGDSNKRTKICTEYNPAGSNQFSFRVYIKHDKGDFVHKYKRWRHLNK